MAERVNRQSPDDGTVFGQDMKSQRSTVNGCYAENAHLNELAMVGSAVIEKLFPELASLIAENDNGLEVRAIVCSATAYMPIAGGL
jgi:hypothetical protein